VNAPLNPSVSAAGSAALRWSQIRSSATPPISPDMREAEPWHHALLGEQNGGYSRARNRPKPNHDA
jgi:hypothetical protein